MKIAFLTSFPLDVRIGSGVVRMIVGLSGAMRNLGYQTQIFHPEYSALNYLQLANLRLQFNRKLAEIDFAEFDFIIGSDFDGYMLADKFHAKYVVLNAGVLADIRRFEHGRILKTLNHLACRECQNVQQARFVIVPSRYAARKINTLYDTDPEKIHIIPLAIDPQMWQEAFAKVELIKNDDLRILCVAKQYPRKGISDLIRAFGLISGQHNHARLNIVGGGPEFENNKNLARELGLTDKITFAGDVADTALLAGFYRNAHIFCLPTYHETFGIVFLEAMAAGLPIVSYASSAVPEVVTEQEGVLCETGNINDLAAALDQLIANPLLIKQFVAQGLKKVQDYTWDHSAVKLSSLLKSI